MEADQGSVGFTTHDDSHVFSDCLKFAGWNVDERCRRSAAHFNVRVVTGPQNDLSGLAVKVYVDLA